MSGSGTGTPVTSSALPAYTLTVMDILEASLRAIRVISPNESLSAGRAKTARQALNMMLALWSTRGLVVPVITQEAFALVATQASYTMGAGGDFDSTRPLAMAGAFVNDGSSDSPLDLIGAGEYNAISDKTTSGVPDRLFFKTTFPLATLYFYPVPDADYAVTLDSQRLLIDYDNLTDDISISPEYYAAIKWNLAIELCPDYEREPPKTVVVLAERSLGAIITLNAANRVEPVKLNLGLEGSGLGSGNIYVG